jgi:hypothetical protein
MRFLAGYACGLAVAALIALLLVHGSRSPSSEPDWPAIASCVWDRWDAGADMAPVMRFCVTWGPKIYGVTEVP